MGKNVKSVILIAFPIFIIFILLFMISSLNTIGAGDTWWYLSCGRYMVQNFTVPKTDVFSHTFYGKPWINSEWLTNVIFYLIFSCLGRRGLAIYKITLVVIIISLIFLRTYLKTKDIYLSLLGLVPIVFVGRIYLDIRAQLGTFLFANICFLLIDLYYKDRKKWLLYIIPLLLIPWVNLHGGFMYAFFILGSFWLGEVINLLTHNYFADMFTEKKSRKIRKDKDEEPIGSEIRGLVFLFTMVIVVSFVTSLINPYNIMAYECNFRFLSVPTFKETLEWIPPFQTQIRAFMTPIYWPYILFFMIFSFANVFFAYTRSGDRGLAIGEFIIGWLTFIMSMNSRRFIPLFVFTTLPFCFKALSLLIGKKIYGDTECEINERTMNRLRLRLPSKKLKNLSSLMDNKFSEESLISNLMELNFNSQEIRIILGSSRNSLMSGLLPVFCMYLLIAGLGYYILQQRIFPGIQASGSVFNYMTVNSSFPKNACEFIKQNKIKGTMFNYYNWGGYIIWRLYPDMPVFIDGRCHQVYSGPFYDEYKYIGAHYDWQEVMDKYNVDIILLSKYNQQELGRTIMKSDKWCLFYHDNNAVMFLRRCEKNRVYIEKMMNKELYVPQDVQPVMDNFSLQGYGIACK